jgi:hypothetical protein
MPFSSYDKERSFSQEARGQGPALSPSCGIIRRTLRPILGVPLWEETERLISMKMTL